MPFDPYAINQWARRKQPLKKVAPPIDEVQPPPYQIDPAATKSLTQFNPGDLQIAKPAVQQAPAKPLIGAGTTSFGAGTQQQQQQMQAAPPPDEGDGNPFDYGSDAGSARAGDTSQPPPEKGPVFGAPTEARDQGEGNKTPTTPTEEKKDSDAAAALQAIADAYEKGQPIEDWKNAEEQRAAEDLARKQDEMKARMGGTDNPYAMLGGVAAQGEFEKRLGDINAKDVDMWFKQQQARANILTQMEEWNRANKPDLYNEWRDKMIGSFGEGWSWGKDGNTIILANGSEKRFEDMNPSEKQMVKDYQAAMGMPPMEPVVSPEEDKANRDSFQSKVASMDPDLANSTQAHEDAGDDVDPDELAIMNDAYEQYKKTGKAPTNQWFKDQYDARGEDYGNAKWADWEDGDSRWNQPAF